MESSAAARSLVDVERRMLDPETLIEQVLKVAPDGVTVVCA